jgi:hypothetical protein
VNETKPDILAAAQRTIRLEAEALQALADSHTSFGIPEDQTYFC